MFFISIFSKLQCYPSYLESWTPLSIGFVFSLQYGKWKTRSQELEYRRQEPVPILQSWSTTFVDSVMWIPSVFGLSPGADTLTPLIRTASDRAMTKCICWLFWIVNPFTLTAELESIVNACNNPQVKFYFLFLTTLLSIFCVIGRLKRVVVKKMVLTVGAPLQGCEKEKGKNQ